MKIKIVLYLILLRPFNIFNVERAGSISIENAPRALDTFPPGGKMHGSML